MQPSDLEEASWDVDRLRQSLCHEVPTLLEEQYPSKKLPFPPTLIEGITEDHISFLARVFGLEADHRYVHWNMAFLILNGDFLEAGGRHDLARQMVEAVNQWMPKVIPQEPLFLILAHAYELDQAFGRTGRLSDELIDFDKEQNERLKSAEGDVEALGQLVGDLEKKLNEIAADPIRSRIFASTIQQTVRSGLLPQLRALEYNAVLDKKSLMMIKEDVIPQDGKYENLPQGVITCAEGIMELMEVHLGRRSQADAAGLLCDWGIEITRDTIKKRAK